MPSNNVECILYWDLGKARPAAAGAASGVQGGALGARCLLFTL